MQDGPHILIVDDEEDIRLTLEARLKAEGYRVSTASLGGEALDEIAKSPPDMVLLDVMMPDIDGYEVCRRIKENEDTRGIVVVFATAMRKTRDKVAGLDIGADDYITKPFNTPELLAKLRVHFRVKDYHSKFEKLVDFAQNIYVLEQEAMTAAVTAEFEKLITADRFSIFIRDEETGMYRILAHNHGEGELDGLEIHIDDSPFMGEALRRMEEVLETDFSASPFAMDEPREKYKDDYALCLPLKVGDELLGCLNLSGNSRGFFDKLHFNFVALVAEILSAALFNMRQYEQIRKLAVTDGLTKLLNHRRFHEKLEEEFARAARFGQPLSCMMMDIDFFKQINDTHGHPAGDVILKRMADTIKSHLRNVDTAARYGGEEFSLLLPQTDAESARILAERIRMDIANREFDVGGNTLKVTVSFGICDTRIDGVGSGKELVARADEALYAAKRGGRNMTVIFEGERR